MKVLVPVAAILLDGYRELNSRKLFWITLALSGLIPLLFFAVDLTETGVRLFHWEIDAPVNSSIIPREEFFKNLFVEWGVGIWLAWIATILALVTTAGIIPDLVTGGAVDMVLSKPVRRSTVFLAKYASGLIFATMQVTAFTAIAFVVLGIKIDTWMPGLFLAIPIVVVFFSYLFSICVLLGLLTRSTIAALMLTILCWVGLWLLNTTDSILLMVKEQQESQLAGFERSLERAADLETRIRAEIEEKGENENRRARLDVLLEGTKEREAATERKRESLERLEFFSDLMVAVKTPLPKTSETILVLKRTLTDATLAAPPPQSEGATDAPLDPDEDPFTTTQPNPENAAPQLEEALGERSVAWVIGTSLAFEAVLLALGLWLFGRRDF